MTQTPDKSLESWIWDAACSIRGAKDAPKFKEFILPLIFAKRLCDVFDDELNRIAAEVGSREKAFKLVRYDKKLVRFHLPLEPKNPDEPVWSVIRTLSDKIGEQLTTHLRSIADSNPLLKGIIDRVDFNATTHGVRDLADDRLSNLIEAISAKRLGLADVEPDIIGRSYEYLIRKFAEGSVSSAGEFYTPKEVGLVMARIMDPEPGMEIYDPACGSAGLLVKCEIIITRIADTFKAWREEEKYSRIVTRDEIAKNDFNISPSRYLHTGEGARYRPIAEIVDELEELEKETAKTDAALKKVLDALLGAPPGAPGTSPAKIVTNYKTLWLNQQNLNYAGSAAGSATHQSGNDSLCTSETGSKDHKFNIIRLYFAGLVPGAPGGAPVPPARRRELGHEFHTITR